MSTATKTDPTAGIFADLNRLGRRERRYAPAFGTLIDAGADDALADLAPLLTTTADKYVAWVGAQAKLDAFGAEQGLKDNQRARYWKAADPGVYSPAVRAEGEALYFTEQAAERTYLRAEQELLSTVAERSRQADAAEAIRLLAAQRGERLEEDFADLLARVTAQSEFRRGTGVINGGFNPAPLMKAWAEYARPQWTALAAADSEPVPA